MQRTALLYISENNESAVSKIITLKKIFREIAVTEATKKAVRDVVITKLQQSICYCVVR